MREYGGPVDWLNELSLISGAVPIVSAMLGALAVLFLLLRRSLRWWIFAVITAMAALALSALSCWAVIHVFFWWAEDLPFSMVLYLALLMWVLTLGSTTALGGLRRRRSARGRTSAVRRSLACVATVVLILFVGIQVNASFGQYPTVGSLLNPPIAIAEAAPPRMQLAVGSHFMATPVSARWHGAADLPTAGTVFATKIPGLVSGFQARDAMVYLPPAYAASQRPVLPVLVLVSGQPGAPEAWLHSSDLVKTLDSYASRHEGVAPIVVIPDPNGSSSANTMCLNSSLAQADSYMAQDVPNWIKTHLDADTNHAHWAIGGFSYGGTCAVQQVTRHPDVYSSFLAVSPEKEPALTVDRKLTIDRAFKGDAAAFDAQVPLTLLAKNRYPLVRGWFAAGAQDAQYSANVKILEKAARQAGMTIESASYPGGHSWSVVNAALPKGLAFTFVGIGLL